MKTSLCNWLGIDVPILSAPMGPALSTPALAAAVSNAGGLGTLSFGALPPPALRELVRKVRDLTSKPFGVNFIMHFPVDEAVRVCIEEQVPVLSFFWGDPSPYVGPAHRAGLLVIDQVGSVEAAQRSAGAGVDVVIAQGYEAGGHVIGQTTTLALVPRVVDTVHPVPVVAAGGIADGRGIVAALALGAEGVSMGTRFLATIEAAAHPMYKDRLVRATEEDTVYTTLFGREWTAPHRVLRTPFVESRLSQSEQEPDERVIGWTEFAGERVPVQSGASLPPDVTTSGDVTSMALLAGQSVGQVDGIRSARDVMVECIAAAHRALARLDGMASVPAQVRCETE